MSRTLVIGDIHEPVSHPAYLKFCIDMYTRNRCDSVVFIGDVVDWHGISFHARSPSAPGVEREYELAYAGVQRWYQAFPDAYVMVGNHDERVLRLAESVNIPSSLIRNYAEVWDTPGWSWQYDLIQDEVYYFHGTGRSGKYPAWNAVQAMGMSVVMGHVHSAAGVKWGASPNRRWFGMDTGCGVDDKAYAFAYNKHNKIRSMLGCGIVDDGIGHYIPMQCGPGETYARSKFKANPLLR